MFWSKLPSCLLLCLTWWGGGKKMHQVCAWLQQLLLFPTLMTSKRESQIWNLALTSTEPGGYCEVGNAWLRQKVITSSIFSTFYTQSKSFKGARASLPPWLWQLSEVHKTKCRNSQIIMVPVKMRCQQWLLPVYHEWKLNKLLSTLFFPPTVSLLKWLQYQCWL